MCPQEFSAIFISRKELNTLGEKRAERRFGAKYKFRCEELRRVRYEKSEV